MADGPNEARLYEVIKPYGRPRYLLEFKRDGELLARVQAKRAVDVMDALFLGPEFRFRLMGSLKTISEPWGCW